VSTTPNIYSAFQGDALVSVGTEDQILGDALATAPEGATITTDDLGGHVSTIRFAYVNPATEEETEAAAAWTVEIYDHDAD
jgi:hypothetical protein